MAAEDDRDDRTPMLSRLVAALMRGDLAILVLVVSFSLGISALMLTPREEDPQITVPMADLLVSAPGLTPREVERQISRPLEMLLFQVEGVENVYSKSMNGRSVTTVRFFVGEDRERSLIRLQKEIDFYRDRIPPQVSDWVIKPRDIDDVPILVIALWSDRPEVYGDFELRRMAEELLQPLAGIRDTNRVRVVGGRPRTVRVEPDPTAMAARRVSPEDLLRAIRASNVNRPAGSFQREDEEFILEAGPFLRDAEELGGLVVGVRDDRPVYLRDVAEVIDGPSEVEHYSWIGFGPAEQRNDGNEDNDDGNNDNDGISPESGADGGRVYPSVHLCIAKRPGGNNVTVAEEVLSKLEELAAVHLPDGVRYRVLRNDGRTADEKVNQLIQSLGFAVASVMVLVTIVMGWRTALVIAIAVPVTYSLTLFFSMMIGYSINRVTLFALILALGLLVDDPITDVENIARYLKNGRMAPRDAVLRAVQEVRPALIASTLTVIASFLPQYFLTGMIGVYMRPMAINVPIAVTISTVIVSFMVTPWLSMAIIGRGVRGGGNDDEGRGGDQEGGGDEGGDRAEPQVTGSAMYRFYSGMLRPIIRRRWASRVVVALVAALLVASLLPPVFRLVPIKMMLRDDNDEFQVVIDMPESATLERTAALAMRLGGLLGTVNEVEDYTLFVGVPSPVDFNGMVRRYYLREETHQADIRVNLAPNELRERRTHELVLELREEVDRIARQFGANVKLVEIPPGPPVLATIAAEVYGPPGAEYGELIDAARTLRGRLEREPGVVDEDTSARAPQTRYVFEVDRPKAALVGITADQIGRTLQMAVRGMPAGVLHDSREVMPSEIILRLPRQERSSLSSLEDLVIVGSEGALVPIGELGQFARLDEPQSIMHKDLRRVVMVEAETAGRPPTDVIFDVRADRFDGPGCSLPPEDLEPRPVGDRHWLDPGGGLPWSLPEGFEVVWSGEGEYDITLTVYRDLGLAYAAALVLIFVILMFQTGSRIMPMVIMSAIPLTLIGVMPGFWLLNVVVDRPVGGFDTPFYFNATAVIGMIVLAGVVNRNSVLLIDFIQEASREGLDLEEAIIRSAAVRTRPILLTAATTLVGNLFITPDPVFSGLAWAIIFGIATSNLFTLLVVPVIYPLIFGRIGDDGRVVSR